MNAVLSRRHLLRLAGTLPLAGFFPSPTRSEPITTSLLMAEFAKAVAAHAGRQLMASLFNGSEGPSNVDVIAAIEKSTAELKDYVSRDVREALTESKIVELRASAKTAFDELISYAGARPENKEAYSFQLQDADRAARSGADLADALGEPAIAVFSMFVSLQIVSAGELFRLRGDRGVYQAFGVSLLKSSELLSSKVNSFLGKWSPGVRLGIVTCTGMSNERGQGFDAPSVTCEFTLDGERVMGAAGFTAGREEAASKIVRAAHDKYQKTEAAVLAEYSALVNSVGYPMLEIAAIWRGLSAEITGADIPYFRHDPSIDFPPIPVPSR